MTLSSTGQSLSCLGANIQGEVLKGRLDTRVWNQHEGLDHSSPRGTDKGRVEAERDLKPDIHCRPICPLT